MFNFFKKKENSNRTAFCQKFERAIKELHAADHKTQVAVGTAINMADAIFQQSYETPQNFRNAESSEQLAYIDKITAVEDGLRNKQGEHYAALGFSLYKMWLGVIASRDNELFDRFYSEIAYFSNKGI